MVKQIWLWIKHKEASAGLHDYLIVLFTLVLTLVGVGQWFLARQSIKNADLQQRPWVSVDATATTPLTFKDGRIIVAFSFTFHNSGQLPATNAVFFAEMKYGIAPPVATAYAKALCDSFSPKDHGPRFNSQTIFPGKDAHFTEVLAQHEIVPHAADGTTYPYVVGCLTYLSPLDESQWHHSDIIFDLEKPGVGGDASSPIKYGEDVPVKALQLNSVLYPLTAD